MGSPPGMPPPQMQVPVQPQPTATGWAYGIAETPDGSKLVVIQIFMVTGTVFLFLTGPEAEAVGGEIATYGKQASSPLTLPPPTTGLISPNGTPLRSAPEQLAPGPEPEPEP